MPRSLLVTGASTGIGQACALTFDREGWTVFAGVRREADGKALAAQASSRLAWLLLDVTSHAQVAAARDTIEAACRDRGLDAVVNNAGIAIAAPIEFVPPAELRRQFEVNVFGLVDVTQAFIPLLRKAKGRIVNIGSIAGRVTTPLVLRLSTTSLAVAAGMAKPMPTLPPEGENMAVLIPTTSPSRLKAGPPELPLLIEASICKKSS